MTIASHKLKTNIQTIFAFPLWIKAASSATKCTHCFGEHLYQYVEQKIPLLPVKSTLIHISKERHFTNDLINGAYDIKTMVVDRTRKFQMLIINYVHYLLQFKTASIYRLNFASAIFTESMKLSFYRSFNEQSATATALLYRP